jgi:hypothetical protein
MSDASDNLTPPRAHKKLGGAYSPDERMEKQARFLMVYRECGNVKYSCEMAGISRETFYQWKRQYKTFQKLLEEVEPDVDDTVEYAAYEEGVLGVIEPVVSMGQPVYEYVPDLDEEGNPQYDSKGKPLMKRGKMLTVRKRNATVLITLLKARLPHKYREKQQIEHSGSLEVLNGARNALLSDLERLPDVSQEQAPDSST